MAHHPEHRKYLLNQELTGTDVSQSAPTDKEQFSTVYSALSGPGTLIQRLIKQ